jgi:hypothetical protein
MSNATAIRVGPARRFLSRKQDAFRPQARREEWAPAPKEKAPPREWKMITSPALAWAMVQILVDRTTEDSP